MMCVRNVRYMGACLHLSKRSHVKCACVQWVLSLFWVCLCSIYVCNPSMCCSLHLSQSTCSHQVYTYTYRTMCWGPAVEGYRPAFCIWLTGVTPNCTPHTNYSGHVLWIESALWFESLREKCTESASICISLRDVSVWIYVCVCECVCVSIYACCCVPKAIITVQFHHIPPAWLKVASVPFQSTPFFL